MEASRTNPITLSILKQVLHKDPIGRRIHDKVVNKKGTRILKRQLTKEEQAYFGTAFNNFKTCNQCRFLYQKMM